MKQPFHKTWRRVRGYRPLTLPILLAVLFLSACIDPYEVEFNEPEELLVVEGIITDSPGPYEIRLSLSAPLDTGEFQTVDDASLQIVQQENGQAYPLTLSSPGVYLSDSVSLRGEVGQHYRLEIQWQGQAYESDWMELQAVAEIDSLHYEFDQRVTPSGALEGLQFFVNSTSNGDETQFYRWQWVETWRYSVPLATNLIYLGNNEIDLTERKETCYQTVRSTNISIANSREGLVNHPLVFVSTETSRLRLRYSLLLRQYAMDENEFLYWKLIQESTENLGSLFDRQPQSRAGNIRSTTDEGTRVLGYFSASAVAEKRIFLTGIETLPLGTIINPGFFSGCLSGMDTVFVDPLVPQAALDEEVFKNIELGRVFFNFLAGITGQGIMGYLLTSPTCADCTELGGTTEKPDFWIE